METITTAYGDLPVTGQVERFADGQARAVFPAGPAHLATPAGELCPQYTIDDSRRQDLIPLLFHPNGRIRSMSLEQRSLVTTSIGPLPAELVTFHPNGALARVFPLNGKLSGYWSEEDEARLAEPLTVPLAQGPLTARFVSVAFDTAGRLRSLTLWPGEEVTIASPLGPLPTRLGISFHPDGSLRSLEPAKPVAVPTPVGPIRAFDPDAIGVCGVSNSLVFSPDGAVTAVATVRTSVTATLPDGQRRTLAPSLRECLCGGEEKEVAALRLTFRADRIEVTTAPGRPPTVLPTTGTTFTTSPYLAAFAIPLAPKRCAG